MNNAAATTTTERSILLKEEQNIMKGRTISTADSSLGDFLLDTDVDLVPFPCRCCLARVDIIVLHCFFERVFD